jgi:nucleotide-binding universal stress UspA family protein
MNPAIGLNATFAKGTPSVGNVAFLSQSGALLTAILDWSQREEVGFSAIISLRKLEDLTPQEVDLRYAPEPIVEFGSPADRILQAAEDRDAGLIVLGVRPDHIDASTHLPWATAHRVVTQANCPVLTVRG